MRFTRKTIGRLSQKRRNRFAPLAVLIAGLLAVGGMYAALVPASADEIGDDIAMIAKGRQLYLVGCSSCHGTNAEGIMTKRGNQYGPSLAGVGAASVVFQMETGRMPMVQPGPQAVRKAPVYTTEETNAIAAYIASIAPGPGVPEESAYDPAKGDASRGGAFFRTNCTACHNYAGTGGALPEGKHAPTLVGVEPRDVYLAMLTGPQQMPIFSDEVLTPEAKRDIIAFLAMNEEDPNYGGFAMGSYGPVADGMFGWLLGIGGLVVAAVWITASSARAKNKKKETAA